MNRCYEYQTSIGPFYIVKRQNIYHAVFAGISIESHPSADKLAAVLSNGYRFNLFGPGLGEIDTADLGIPTNISDWICCYFVPNNIKANFRHTGPGSAQGYECEGKFQAQKQRNIMMQGIGGNNHGNRNDT